MRFHLLSSFPSLSLLVLLSLLLLPSRTLAVGTGMSFCKCICFSQVQNSTIIPLYRPAVPSNPCLSCTRQFCLDQKLPACVGAQNPEEDPDTATGEGGDVEARCFRAFFLLSFPFFLPLLLLSSAPADATTPSFSTWTESPPANSQLTLLDLTERDSPKSHFIVISFLVVTGTLLVLAGLKHYGLDIPAIFAAAGVRGVVQVRSFLYHFPFEADRDPFFLFEQEITQFLSGLARRRGGRGRGGAAYSTVSS
jgi:hypothetical protein